VRPASGERDLLDDQALDATRVRDGVLVHVAVLLAFEVGVRDRTRSPRAASAARASLI
jgi:hypothetical protein